MNREQLINFENKLLLYNEKLRAFYEESLPHNYTTNQSTCYLQLIYFVVTDQQNYFELSIMPNDLR